jgi:flagellar motor protein MotB
MPACAVATTWIGADQPVGMVLFKNASAALAANDRALLQRIAQHARQSGATIRVIGHADEATGALDAVNRQLVNFDFSSLRAETAATELQRAGLPAHRIVVEARSDQEPLCAAGSGDPVNRRVQLDLSHGPASRS